MFQNVLLIEQDVEMIDKIKSISNNIVVTYEMSKRIFTKTSFDLIIVNEEKVFNELFKKLCCCYVKTPVIVIVNNEEYADLFSKHIHKNMNVDSLYRCIHSFCMPKFNCEIITILSKLGVSSHLSGYIYLQEAIGLVIKDHFKSLKHEIYPKIASTYQTNIASVERNIRTAIENGWTSGNIGFKNQLFKDVLKYCQDRPTNSQYLFKVASEITLHKE